MLKQPDIHKANTYAEVFEIAEQFVKQTGIAVNLTTWPGAWTSIANGLRWESCEYSGEEAENRLLLADLLMHGEARYTALRREDRERQNDLVDEAATWLEGWIEGVNEEIRRNPSYARNLDSLTTIQLAIAYARAFNHRSRDDRFQAMRCAVLRELEVFIFPHNGHATVATGAQIKAMTNRENHRGAVLVVQGRRI